jgi:hypothetical protein
MGIFNPWPEGQGNVLLRKYCTDIFSDAPDFYIAPFSLLLIYCLFYIAPGFSPGIKKPPSLPGLQPLEILHK